MEKVKIKTVLDIGKKWQDKSIFSVELEDGRKGSSFESDALNWKGEIELEIKEGKEFDKYKNYIFSHPKSDQKNNKFQKDYIFEKRKESLEAALKYVSIPSKMGDKITSKEVIDAAEFFFTYLNKK